MSSKKSPYMVGCILIPEAERSTTSSEFVPMGISIPWETVIVPLLTSALPPSLHPKRISATAKEPTANLYTEFIMVIFERYRWSVSILSFFRCPYWTMHNRERHLGFGSRWCSPRPEVRVASPPGTHPDRSGGCHRSFLCCRFLPLHIPRDHIPGTFSHGSPLLFHGRWPCALPWGNPSPPHPPCSRSWSG